MPSASSYFMLFLVSEKLFWKYSRNWTPQKPKSLFYQEVHGVRRIPGGGPWSAHTIGRRPPSWSCHQVVGAYRAPPTSPLRLFIHILRKALNPKQNSTKNSVATVIINPSLGGFGSSSRHLSREGNHHRRPLHHHACLRSDWSSDVCSSDLQFLFSTVFVFQKSCSGNILGIGRNKRPSPYFSVTYTESEGESGCCPKTKWVKKAVCGLHRP